MKTLNEFNQMLGELMADWQPAKLPPRTEIPGRYCTLEPLDVTKHSRQLFDALNPNLAGWTYLPYGPFDTYESFCVHLKQLIAENNTQLYAVTASGKAMGIAGYLRIDQTHGVIEIGHVNFSKQLQKTPAATEALFLLMHCVFEKLGYRRCEAKCNALNWPSRNASARMGFQLEGIFRQHFIFKQHSRDTAWSSIIDKEWPEVKLRLENWLHPNNFRSDGRRIQRLKK